MTYDDTIFDQWDSFPDCRIRIDLGEGAESVWGKKIFGGFGINNFPLYGEFRYQDIVDSQNVGSPRQLLQRRWNTCIYFCYKPGDTEDEDRKRRGLIVDALQEEGGLVSFFFPGAAQALFKGEFSTEQFLEVLNRKAPRQKSRSTTKNFRTETNSLQAKLEILQRVYIRNFC